MADQIVTYEQALAQGLKWYFTGEPCKRGHIGRRNLSRSCLECRHENWIARRTETKASRGSILANELPERPVSRDEAISLGLNYYFTGAPCKRGHISIRYLAGPCVACRTPGGRKFGAVDQATHTQEQGETTFFTGTACINGHIAERLKSGGRCVACLREKSFESYRQKVSSLDLSVDGIILSREDALLKGLPWYFTGTPCKYGHISKRTTVNQRCCACQAARLRGLTLEVDPDYEPLQWRQIRLIARKEGRITYNGKTCETCGSDIRAALDGRCWPCHQERHKQWRNENAAHVSQRMREWQENNKDRVREYRKEYFPAYYAKNRTKLLEKEREYRKANPHILKKAQDKYREKNRELLLAKNANRRARRIGIDGHHTFADRAALLAAQGHRCANCNADLRRVKKHLDHIMPLALGGSNDKRNIQYLCEPCNLAKAAKDPIAFARQHGRLL